MTQQVVARLVVVCGLAVGVVACGETKSSSGAQSSSQPQSGSNVGDAGKDMGKGVADAGKVLGKSLGDLGKSVGSGSGEKTKESGARTGDAAAGLGKAVASGATKIGVAVADAGTDAGITAAVNSRLKAEMPADAIKVNALTNAGVVTLKGSVPSAAARTKAEQIAKSTSGVKNVVNQLDVK